MEPGSEEGEEDIEETEITDQTKQVTFYEEGKLAEMPGAKIEDLKTNQVGGG